MSETDGTVADQLASMFKGRTALVLEDEPSLADAIRAALTEAGLDRVSLVAKGEEALKLASAESFDILILDRLNSGMEGLEVLRRLRRDGRAASSQAIALVVSALGNEAQRLDGIAAGAKDYIPKPIAEREIVMRVAAHLAHAPRDRYGGFSFDDKSIYFGDKPINLGNKDLSYRIIAELIRARGIPRSKSMLWDRCWTSWSYVPDDFENTVDSRIAKLRKLMGQKMADLIGDSRNGRIREHDSVIANVWGRGFILRDLSDLG